MKKRLLGLLGVMFSIIFLYININSSIQKYSWKQSCCADIGGFIEFEGTYILDGRTIIKKNKKVGYFIFSIHSHLVVMDTSFSMGLYTNKGLK